VSKLSISEQHAAECERLRRLREALPMQVSIELDEDKIRFLADLYGFDAKERSDPKVMGAAFELWSGVAMRLQLADGEEQTV
jgi:hypothetical protein